jgi:CRP-like cAMP-binding protein
MQEYIDKLKGMPLFEGISDDDLAPMLKCLGSYTRTYSNNEIIFLESNEILSVGVVLSGTVHMIKDDSLGNTALFSYIREGELFGETFACGTKLKARVSFQATAATSVLFLPFDKILHSCTMSCVFHHRLVENMVRLISEKNIMLMDKIDITSQKTLRSKILCYLSIQAERSGGSRLTIPLDRNELAEYLCADRSAVSRELSAMARDGLIEYNKNKFHIL